MKVKELIRLLEDRDPEANVCVKDYNGGDDSLYGAHRLILHQAPKRKRGKLKNVQWIEIAHNGQPIA